MLRSAGVSRCGGYIDDFLIAADTEAECARQLQVALDVIHSLGLPTADKITQPTQSIKFLGVVFDSVGCDVSMPADASRILLSDLRALQASGFCISRSRFRSLCGTLSWFACVMLGARTYMRRLWDASSAFPRRGARPLPAPARADILWWISRLSSLSWSGSWIWFKELPMPLITMKSDASGEIGCVFTWALCSVCTATQLMSAHAPLHTRNCFL